MLISLRKLQTNPYEILSKNEHLEENQLFIEGVKSFCIWHSIFVGNGNREYSYGSMYIHTGFNPGLILIQFNIPMAVCIFIPQELDMDPLWSRNTARGQGWVLHSAPAYHDHLSL